ncbi:MAG: DUF3427 domain-containing protein [Candidatus Izemoplasmatales bacterium]|nr:DUF3427 domain-containing protein [Candidatus Izemoplasmatales bacterium]
MENKFLANHSKETFLEHIIHSIEKCSSFYFSVSFIKKAGIVLLVKAITDALERGAQGKIITSTYQNFTDIASLNQFLSWQEKYKNFSCHIDFNSFGDKGFHTKGYLFDFPDLYEVVIGSSNITRFALIKNIEWNILLSSKEKSESYKSAFSDFESLWTQTNLLSKDLIKQYVIQLEYSIEKWDMDYYTNFISVNPNYMQRKALKELRRYRDQGVNKALVIAATGSGKTHLAAFDARNYGAKRLLFIVHRETILIEAIKIFRSVFGSNISLGLFSGNAKEIDSSFIFSMNLTMSNNLEIFDPHEFDYIVLDEVHHAAADTYQKIITYFKPEFLLGLTATPDRMDNKDIYDIFDKNVPFDLRLRDAIINDLVVPFHYFGIRDKLVNYGHDDIRLLIQEISKQENCEFISEEIKKHLPQDKLKAIGYCRSVEHARLMADNMSLLGYATMYLTGQSNTGERIKAFHDLHDEAHALQIIFTVDILNEGVDVPGINMVLFLRPTESSVIFLQQLGRGLRKFTNKSFLTVLDFIGNSYKRSVQIIKALGSLSESTIIEKQLLMDLVRDNFKSIDIPGVVINIDELSKEDINKYLESTNFNMRAFLKKDYENFKSYVGKSIPPTHMDFLNYDYAPELMRFIKVIMSGKNKSYYNFLEKIGESVPAFDTEQKGFIEYLSNLLPLVRPDEFEIISELMIYQQLNKEDLIEHISIKHDFFKKELFENALLNLQNEFLSTAEKTNNTQYVLLEDNMYTLNLELSNVEFREHILDLIEYGLTRYAVEFGEFNGNFKLYGNYTTEQFMMALCEKTYKYYKGTKIEKDGTVYILANLKKDKVRIEHLKYEDEFESPSIFKWESETSTTLQNHRGLIGSKVSHLFIRKTSEEDGITLPFTYIGTGKLENPRESSNSKKTLLFDIKLDHPLPEYLQFDFFLKK